MNWEKLNIVSWELFPVNKHTWMFEFIVFSICVGVILTKPMPLLQTGIVIGIISWLGFSLVKSRNVMGKIK